MSASSAQLQFAAEFVLFLAAASGLAVVSLRPTLLNDRRPATAALTLGFVGLGTAAFLHGSQLVEDGGDPTVIGLRAAGVAGVLVGCLWGWVAGGTARLLLVLSAAFVSAATFADAGDPGTLSRLVLAGGGVALGAAVVTASRRSIAARVAASAAATLLIVVLVLGVALSAVLVDTVQDSAVDRLERRARNEAANAQRVSTALIEDAKVVAGALNAVRDTLVAVANLNSPSDALSGALGTISNSFLADVKLAYVAPTRKVHGEARLDKNTVVDLAGSPVVAEALEEGAPRGSVEVFVDKALAVGVHPVPPETGRFGVTVAVSPLDDTYLAQTSTDDAGLSLALVGNSGIVARRGPQPRPSTIAAMVHDALVDGRGSSKVVGSRFVAVASVRAGDGSPKLALVASTPTTLVNQTRDELFRNLFLVALGGTLLALLLASLVGARIGVGLSRLRRAAEGIQAGDFGVRAGVTSDDEVGVLGRTFDSMAASVQEKTAAEVRLRGRLEAVVAGMGEALIAVDGKGLITDFNRAAEELLGVRHDRAAQRPVDEVVRLTGEDGSPISLLQSQSPGGRGTLGTVQTSDGDLVPVTVSVGALRGPGAESGGSVVVLADLRREREVEQMKTQFLSRIGHELRTPLTPLMGYTEIFLRKDVPADRARHFYEDMYAKSKEMLRTVEMLEFFATSGAGRVLLRPEQVDPRSLIDDVIGRAQQKSGLPPDEIRRRVRRTTPTVTADRRLLSRCLDELLDNALKFSTNGARVVVGAERAPGGGVEISVVDQGIGMSLAEQEEAFGEFVQVDAGDTRAQGGLGLGLAYVRRVVEAHGGRLTCSSEPGKGSKFSIFLPNVPKEAGR